ncbi:hypothetical protein Droror1_Dr00020098 [Drosera rotundifolia]
MIVRLHSFEENVDINCRIRSDTFIRLFGGVEKNAIRPNLKVTTTFTRVNRQRDNEEESEEAKEKEIEEEDVERNDDELKVEDEGKNNEEKNDEARQDDESEEGEERKCDKHEGRNDNEPWNDDHDDDMEGYEVEIEKRKYDGPDEENDDDEKVDGHESTNEWKDVMETVKSISQEEHEEEATLIEWYTIAWSGNEIGEIEYIKEVNVRRQDDGHSCGVFVCLWEESLMKENVDTFVDIYLKRAQMALTILCHKYSVYLKDNKEPYVN